MIDHIIFNLAAGQKNEVLMNVYLTGETTKHVYMPIEDLYDKDFFKKVYEKAKSMDVQGSHKYTCEVCGAKRNTFLRKYGKRWFCGFCGTHYDIVDNNLVLVAKV